MSLLVIGKTGQVARELSRRAPEARFVGRDEAELSDPETCAKLVQDSGAQVVINAAAYTTVDKAESEENLAHLVNAQAPGAMAGAAALIGAVFVHISTDYVFDGTGSTPFTPDAPTAPLGAYGRTKLAGEEAVRRSGAAFAILRTSWVFSAHGTNFVKTMLRLAESRDAVSVVADQIGGPTPAGDIAEACLLIGSQLAADPSKSGTYHYTGSPDTSWAGFAREIFTQSGHKIAVTNITTADYPTPAQRPGNSRLDCSTTEQAFGISRPDWHKGLTEVLNDLGDQT
ncbi:dTDP-4-dehydrorhamnose reductase [Celeribacter sp.]|uniref:dTDP-4-dehydrorhamnose reductase n=1 Tax=Celeribacter sp. TaxID=1890673 RepID=UPI003A8CAC84